MEKRSVYSKVQNSQFRKMKLRSAMSASKCSVFSCKNHPKDTQYRRPSLAYYPFPRDKELLTSWKKFCNKTDNDTGASIVCADHFSPEDFIITSEKAGSKKICRILKATAVPSIYKPEFIIEDSSETCERTSLRSSTRTNGQTDLKTEVHLNKINSAMDVADESNGLNAVKKGSEASTINEKEKVYVVESSTSQTRSRGSPAYHPRKSSSKEIPIRRNISVRERFVNLLKDYPVLLDPSISANIRARKSKALRSFAYAYKKKFGKHISRFQLRQKVDDMTKYIRDKFNKARSNVTPSNRLKKWEEDFFKLMQAKRVPIGIIPQDRIEDTSCAIMPYNHNLPRNLLKSLIERSSPRCLSAETDETEKLSFEQLQRLLTLEQLKLIRLQQLQSQKEIERLKLKSITESREKI